MNSHLVSANIFPEYFSSVFNISNSTNMNIHYINVHHLWYSINSQILKKNCISNGPDGISPRFCIQLLLLDYISYFPAVQALSQWRNRSYHVHNLFCYPYIKVWWSNWYPMPIFCLPYIAKLLESLIYFYISLLYYNVSIILSYES